MGKYSDLVKEFKEDYEDPRVRDYVVGFSGITPDKKVKPGEIDHEELGGLAGGDISGHYHLRHEQVVKYEGYSGQISTLRTDAFAEAKRVEDKEDGAVSTLRTDAFAEAKRVENEAASKVNNVKAYAESEIQKSEARTTEKLTSAVRTAESIAEQAREEAARVSEEVSTAREEFVAGLTEVSNEQAELSGQNEELSARFDEVISGVTEDGEILDARIDADGKTHATLGANLRSVHEELHTGLSETRGQISASHEHMQEQADELAELALSGILSVREDAVRLRAKVEESAVREREDAEDLSCGILSLAQAMTGHITHEKAQEEHKGRHDALILEHMQEQTDEVAYAAMSLAVQLSRKTTGGTIYRNPLDWSKTGSLAIPEPRCAVVNITGITAMPESKTAELDAVMEFWDKAGNYFRKPIVCSAQGQTSLRFPKKNLKFDLMNEDGSEFTLKIGNWVEQDGFHLKSYYTDYFRGLGAVSYKFLDEIMRARGTDSDRPWKTGLGVTGGVTARGGTQKGTEIQLETGALCHPDGFPCLVYLNGEFYGIYAWQLKKHRANYHMEKSNVKHIHLDGDTVYFRDGTIGWTGFEVRNPNKLYTMDGKKYDGDAPKELIDETSAKYDPENKDHVRTAQVKAAIEGVVSKFQEVKRLCNEYKSSPTPAKLSSARAAYEAIFEPGNEIDYLIFSDVTYNEDGFDHNVQMTTYDGVKWYSNAYDLDQTFGGSWLGESLYAPQTQSVLYTWRGNNTFGPCHCLPIIYKAELESRYKELRDAGIIETEHILGYIKDWVNRIGTGNYELEYERWPGCPTYTDSIYRVKKWLETQIANMDKVYNYEPESARLDRIEEAVQELIDGEGFTYEGAKVSRNAEVKTMMEDVFDGDGTGGEELSEIPGELKERVTTAEDFNDMLDEIFG